jgi:Holliday junction resolvasome RuvABC endonuclease subunit
MTTLALDLGQNIGWMKGSAVGALESGTIELEGGSDLGVWLLDAMMKLPKLIRGVDDIAVEQPFLGSSYYPARKLLGLLGVVYACARTEGIAAKHVNEIPVSTAKKALAGHGQADKDMMIAAACAFWGFEPHEIDEHQADASAILYVHHFGEAPSKRQKPRTSKGVSLLRGPAR